MAEYDWFRMIAASRALSPSREADVVNEPASASHSQPSRQNFKIPHYSCTREQVHSGSINANFEEDQLLVNEADRVWHVPSVDQMCDMLLATIMSASAPRSLGPEHFSAILHVLEEYRTLKRRIIDTDKRLSEEMDQRKRQVEEFEALTSRWMVQEAFYKGEIRRLTSVPSSEGYGGASAGFRSPGLCLPEEHPNKQHQHQTREKSSRDKDVESGSDEDNPINIRYPKETSLSHHHSIVGRRRILDASSDISISRPFFEKISRLRDSMTRD